MKKAIAILMVCETLITFFGCTDKNEVLTTSETVDVQSETHTAQSDSETAESSTEVITDAVTEEETEAVTEIALTEAQISAAAHLIECWKQYITYSANIYGTEQWALAYVEDFLKTNDWKDLSKARTACINAAVYYNNLEMKIDDLSADEYSELLKMGISTDYQATTFSILSVMLESARDRLRKTLLPMLEEYVFTKSEINILNDYTSLYKQINANYSVYDVSNFNYQMADLEKYGFDTTDAKKHAEDCCNSVFQSGFKWLATTAECQSKIEEILTNDEKYTLEEAKLISAFSDVVATVNQSIANSDVTYLAKEKNVILSAPAFLPAPDWFSTNKVFFQTMKIGNDGSVTHQDAGSQLNDLPYVNVIIVPGISRDDCVDYVLLAMDFGYKGSQGTDGTLYLTTNDYTVSFSPYDATYYEIDFIYGDIAFVPYWYIVIQNSAQ